MLTLRYRLLPLLLVGVMSLPTFAADVPITVVNLEGLPMTKKIVLGNFVLDFQDQYIKTKSGFNIMGMGSTDRVTATNSVTLPEPSVLQALTDFAYLRVQEKLRERGYEVVLPGQLSETARPILAQLLTADLIKSGTAFETRDGTSMLYTPTGVNSVMPGGGCDYYHALAGHKNLLERVTYQAATLGRNSSSPSYERKLAMAENAPLLKVWITVGFGDVEANGAGSFISKRQTDYTTGSEKITVTNAANAKATSGMYLRPSVTRFAFVNPVDSHMNWNCGITVFGAFKPPADGEVLIQLSDKYRDDGGLVASLSNRAASIGVTDNHVGAGIVARSVKENDDATGPQTAGGGQAIELSRQGSSTTGRVDTNDGFGTQLNTRSAYATSIRSDYYATSVIKMVEDVTSGFIQKMK